jgi:hypothetical protein
MPEICTCGAQLPPDALFCHKCGKPQREIAGETVDQAEPPLPEVVLAAPAAAAPVPATVDFHNPIAVRIALTMALVTTLLSWLPYLNFALWVGAGFFAVFFYRRRTGQLFTIRTGMQLGWITGVLTFVINTLLFTATVVPTALNGGLAELFQQQFKNLPSQDANVMEAMRLLQSPAGIATMLMIVLVMLFVFITCLAIAGGALGARLVGRE